MGLSFLQFNSLFIPSLTELMMDLSILWFISILSTIQQLVYTITDRTNDGSILSTIHFNSLWSQHCLFITSDNLCNASKWHACTDLHRQEARSRGQVCPPVAERCAAGEEEVGTVVPESWPGCCIISKTKTTSHWQTAAVFNQSHRSPKTFTAHTHTHTHTHTHSHTHSLTHTHTHTPHTTKDRHIWNSPVKQNKAAWINNLVTDSQTKCLIRQITSAMYTQWDKSFAALYKLLLI